MCSRVSAATTGQSLTTPYAVQAHCMLRRAIGRDVSRERLVRAVNSYMQRHEPNMLAQFELLVNTVSMEEAVQL